jgi:hypothetical protein
MDKNNLRFKLKRKEFCCFCRKKIIGYGNNAEPLKKGICCKECYVKVLKVRIEIIKREGKKGNTDDKKVCNYKNTTNSDGENETFINTKNLNKLD